MDLRAPDALLQAQSTATTVPDESKGCHLSLLYTLAGTMMRCSLLLAQRTQPFWTCAAAGSRITLKITRLAG